MKIKINKFDAAKNQLETGISLFFENGDPVSIHTLTCGAYNVLRDICDHMGTRDYAVKNTDFIREDRRAEYIKMVNEPENFFKHADKDPEEILEFNPEATEVILLDAVQTYHWIIHRTSGATLPPLLAVYKMWFIIKDPGILSGNYAALGETIKQAARGVVDVNNRSQFLHDFLPMANAIPGI